MEKIIKDGFIRVYNRMIEDKSEYRVTPDELYVYSILFINRRQDESMLTSIGMIEATMSEKAKLSNRQATNRQKIKEALIGLIQKEVLIMTCEDKVEDIKTNTFITMKINDEALCKNSNSDTFNGFEEVYIDNFKMMLSPQELLIYTLSQRFSNKGGFEGSYERWAMFLDVSRNTAVKLLNEAEQRGIITIQRGKHIAKNRQEINRYFSVDFTNDEQESTEQESHTQNESIDQSNQQEPAVAFGSKEDKVVAFDSVKKDKPTMSIKDKVGDSLPF